MTSLPERDQVMALVAEAIVAGARQERESSAGRSMKQKAARRPAR